MQIYTFPPFLSENHQHKLCQTNICLMKKLLLERAVLGGMKMEQDANGGVTDADISISAIASYLVTGEYYFSNNSSARWPV